MSLLACWQTERHRTSLCPDSKQRKSSEPDSGNFSIALALIRVSSQVKKVGILVRPVTYCDSDFRYSLSIRGCEKPLLLGTPRRGRGLLNRHHE